MKTNELEGVLLDYWVAKAEGHEWRCPWMLEQKGMAEWQSYEHAWGNPTRPYSTEWEFGGPIIERESISIYRDEYRDASGRWNGFGATMPLDKRDPDHTVTSGPTHLIAAMRAYVASKFGDTVPDEVAA